MASIADGDKAVTVVGTGTDGVPTAADFILTGAGAGNYTLVVTDLVTTLSTNADRTIGTVTSRTITKLSVAEIDRPAKTTYTYPDTALKLVDMWVTLAYSDSTTERFAFGSPSYAALGLTYFQTASGAPANERLPSDIGGTPDFVKAQIDVGTTALVVRKSDANVEGTVPLTVNGFTISSTSFAIPKPYAAKTYDQKTAVRFNSDDDSKGTALFVSKGGAAITATADSSATGTHDGTVVWYVADVTDAAKVAYVLIPITAPVYSGAPAGGAAETAAWIKAELTYDDKNVIVDATGAVQGTKTLKLKVLGVVGKNSGNYALNGTIKSTSVLDSSATNQVSKRPLGVSELVVKSVFYGGSGHVTGSAAVVAAPVAADQAKASIITGDTVRIAYDVNYVATSTTSITANTQFPYAYHTISGGTNTGSFDLTGTAIPTTGVKIFDGADANNYVISNTALPGTIKGTININVVNTVVVEPSANATNTIRPLKMTVPIGIDVTNPDSPAYKADQFKVQTSDVTKYEVVADNLKWADKSNVAYVGFNTASASSGTWFKNRTGKTVFNFAERYGLTLQVNNMLGYKFAAAPAVTIKEKNGVTFSVSSKGTVTKGNGYDTANGVNKTPLILNYVFDATASTEKIAAAVLYVKTPRVGDSVGSHLDKPYINYQHEIGEQFDIVKDSIKWYAGNVVENPDLGASEMGPTDPGAVFEKGKQYTIKYEVYANEGYDFVTVDSGTTKATAFIFSTDDGFITHTSSWKATPAGLYQTGDKTAEKYELLCVLTAVEKTGSSEAVPENGIFEMINFNLPVPMNGFQPTATNIIPRNTNGQPYEARSITGGAVSWYVQAGDTPAVTDAVVLAGGKFEAGKTYYAKFDATVGADFALKRNAADAVDDANMIKTLFRANMDDTVTVTDVPVGGSNTSAEGANATQFITVTDGVDKTISVMIRFAPVTGDYEKVATLDQLSLMIHEPKVDALALPAWVRPGETGKAAVTATEWTPKDTNFAALGDYNVAINPEAKAGNVLAPETRYYLNDELIEFVNDPSDAADAGKKAYIYKTAPAGTYTLYYDYAALPKADISQVKLVVTAPEAGATPAMQGTTVTPHVASPYGITWDPADTTYGSNKIYTVTATVTPDAGYQFTERTIFTVNNALAELNGISPDTGAATVEYAFSRTGVTPAQVLVSPVHVTVKAPEYNAAAAAAVPSLRTRHSSSPTGWATRGPRRTSLPSRLKRALTPQRYPPLRAWAHTGSRVGVWITPTRQRCPRW